MSSSINLTAYVALLIVSATAIPGNADSGTTRTYYIAATPVTWNYMPGGANRLNGKPYKAIGSFVDAKGSSVHRPVGLTFAKCLYREYTDGSFSKVKPRSERWQHLGVLGPVIHAEVGDRVVIEYQNNCDFPNSIQTHGIEKVSAGGESVAPGSRSAYVYHVPPRAGPGSMDGSSVIWAYESTTNQARDVDTGLLGPIVVTARGLARADGSPRDVDREFVVGFLRFEEHESQYATRNLSSIAKDHPYGFYAAHSINGYMWSTMPLRSLTMRKGERVRWYVMSGQSDLDLHTPHWHGNTVLIGGMRTDVASLRFASTTVADMIPDNPGIWLLHCHVAEHHEAGMNVRYTVLP